MQTGRHAFFDFGGETQPFLPPEEPDPTCRARATVDGAIELNWDDLTDVDQWSVRRNGNWVATTATAAFRDNTPAVGENTYVIRYRRNGARGEVTCSPNPISVRAEAGPTCISTRNADGSVDLVWTDMGVATYQIRMNGRWLAMATTTAFTHTDAPADASHQVRFRSGGQNVDLACG